jgi:ATP-dependent Lhr-like helicase
MELSGELLSGYFFEDIPGPQFTTAKGLQVFQRRMGHRDIYWMNATDPVSPCGLDIATLKQTVPHRIASHHLVYRGEELIIDSRNHAKSLIIHLDADDPDLPQALGFMQHLLTRTFQPRRRLTIEKINGQPAAESLYIDTLKHGFEAVVEHRSITLHASIR